LAQCKALAYQVALYALGAVWAVQVGAVDVERGRGIPDNVIGMAVDCVLSRHGVLLLFNIAC
jgi:hypothetical protein